MEALSHCVASITSIERSRVSSGRFRKICIHPALNGLAYAEDPAEHQFAEEFTFFEGSYAVLPGIASGCSYMLSNLCKAIFLDPMESLPEHFKSSAFQLVASSLYVLDRALKKGDVRRGMAPVSDRHGEILVPDASTLSKLKDAVTFTKEELNSFLASKSLPPDSLNRLISKRGEIRLADYDVVNGPLLWRPFIDCGDRIVLTIPGMTVSAIRQALLQLATETNVKAAVADLYNKAVWQNVKQSLSFTKNIPLTRHALKPLTVATAADGFFSLDHDKVLYCPS